MVFKKEAEIVTAIITAQRPESREDIGFVPIGLDEPYRVYISEDPLRLRGGNNYFTYVKNNPLILADPMGLAAVPWPIPKCTPVGPSQKNCSIYKAACDRGDKTACLLYQACLNLGDNKWSNCVRCCLQEKYRECNECGCIIVDHLDCWIKCPPVF